MTKVASGDAMNVFGDDGQKQSEQSRERHVGRIENDGISNGDEVSEDLG